MGKDDGRGFQGRAEGRGQEKADALRGVAAFFWGLINWKFTVALYVFLAYLETSFHSHKIST